MNQVSINAKTAICAVIGNPIEHSLSPAIHNACFTHRGLNWAYVAFRVENIQQAINGIRGLNIRGVSVTIPHKISALPYLDGIDATAQTIGSINTIVNTQGRLFGYNSDGAGALQALHDQGHDPAGKHVLILGSGGAARAIAFTLALKSRPGRLGIMGIIPEELGKLADDIKDKAEYAVATGPLTPEHLQKILPEVDILINCTPVGMYPQIQHTPVPAQLLQPKHVVFDIVYNPLKTRLLADAQHAGAVAISGIEMFLNQAAIQFELWTEQKAPKEIMRNILIRHFQNT